jgi:hypothetical protein
MKALWFMIRAVIVFFAVVFLALAAIPFIRGFYSSIR